MIRPHVSLLVAAVRRPLQLPITYVNVTVPRGSMFRMDYILVAWNRTVVVNTQTSPELRFRLVDAKGVAYTNRSTGFVNVTTPGGGVKGVTASEAWRIEYAPGEIITMEVTNMTPTLPANISVTYLGQKSWGVR